MYIIAHRGASGEAPENTKVAFERALESGADGIELDVQLTKDDEVVVFHDWTLDRTTDGRGRIKDKTLAELRELDAGGWFDEKYKGERIPTLEEVMDIIPEDLFLNIELKSQFGEERGLESKVIEIIKEKRPGTDNIIVSSFSHKLMMNIQKECPEIKLGLLLSGDLLDIRKYISESAVKFHSVHPEQGFLNSRFIDAVGEKPVYTFTVNNEYEAEELLEAGVQGIITNYPGKMIKFLKNKR